MASMLENLGAAQTALHRGNREDAVVFLQRLLTSDLGESLVQTQINLVRSGELESVGDWIEICIDQHSDASLDIFPFSGLQILESDSPLDGELELDFSDFGRLSQKTPSGGLSSEQSIGEAKKAKLKDKLAKLRSLSQDESEEEPPNALFSSNADAASSDPFAGLMDMEEFDSPVILEATRNEISEIKPRDRDHTPIAPAAIQDLAFELGEISSSGNYRGEPLLREASSGETANQGFKREDNKTGVESVKSFISEQPSRPSTNLGAIRLEARRLLQTGELDAALDITKKILSRNEDAETETLRQSILEQIEERDLSQIGALTTIPTMSVLPHQLSGYAIDHRAGYLLSLVDGMMTYEDLIDLSGMPRKTTLQILADLVRQEIIG